MAITKFITQTVSDGTSATVDFGSNVLNATVAVQGFSVGFGNTDHHVDDIEVKATMGSTTGSKVSISATCWINDHSSNKGTGSIDVLVIAECES